MKVCPQCFAAARVAFAENYRRAHFDRAGVSELGTDASAALELEEIGVQWRTLALTLLTAWCELESSQCELCAGHGGARETLRERCRRWLHRYAEIGFANFAALAVLGAIHLGEIDTPGLSGMVEWLRERSAGGARFH